MPGVQQAGMTSMVMPRVDGQWDWTANDPQAVVTQDYTLVRATRTIPPFASGIGFTGGASSLNVYSNAPITAVSAGTFATGYPVSNATSAIVFGMAATSIDFTGSLSGLSGMSLNTVYWTCFEGAGNFVIYDTFAHAQAALVFTPSSGSYACSGTAGRVVPTGFYSGSGLTAELAVAPTQGGIYSPEMSSPGSREKIIVVAVEWGRIMWSATPKPVASALPACRRSQSGASRNLSSTMRAVAFRR